MAALGWVVTWIAVIVGGALVRGWVLTVLWSWFITPTFAQAPTLSIPAALGISLIVSFLARDDAVDDDVKRTGSQKLARAVGRIFVAPLLVLAIGWVVHLFM